MCFLFARPSTASHGTRWAFALLPCSSTPRVGGSARLQRLLKRYKRCTRHSGAHLHGAQVLLQVHKCHEVAKRLLICMTARRRPPNSSGTLLQMLRGKDRCDVALAGRSSRRGRTDWVAAEIDVLQLLRRHQRARKLAHGFHAL